MDKWSDDLCEYYGVSEEAALELGTRSSGRKPSLPGSKTCEPVSDMTFEDGCGGAPFLNTFVPFITQESSNSRISITDVDGCEHLKFAEWRLKKKIQERKIPVTLDVKPVKPNELPTYEDKIDLALIFEVLEHVPSPVETIKNLHNQLNDGKFYKAPTQGRRRR